MLMCIVLLSGCCNHQWQAADCDTPETCSLCGLTEGEPLNVDPRFKTLSPKCVFGTWTSEVNIPKSQIVDFLQLPVTEMSQEEFPCDLSVDFMYNGEMIVQIQLTDEAEAAITKLLIAETIAGIYSNLQKQGYTRGQANEYYMSMYGRTIEEDAAYVFRNHKTIFVRLWGVYYVEGDVVYMAMDWNQPMTAFTMKRSEDNQTLTPEGNILALTQNAAYRGVSYQQQKNRFYSALNPYHSVSFGLLDRGSSY